MRAANLQSFNPLKGNNVSMKNAGDWGGDNAIETDESGITGSSLKSRSSSSWLATSCADIVGD